MSVTRSAAVAAFAAALVFTALTSGASAQHPSFSGTWTLNTTLSDNPEQISRALRLDTGLSIEQEFLGPETQGRGDGREGSGRGASGRPGRGQGETDRRRAPQINSEDRNRLTELINGVRFAPTTFTLSQTDDVVISAGARAADTLHPTGKAEPHTLEAGAVNRTTRWVGPLLIVSYDVGRTGTLIYTYSLVPPTRQLLVRVNFERERDRPGPFDVKLVYDLTSAK